MSEASHCVVCQARIQENTTRKQGDEAVECEGTYSGWLHRRCAGLSKEAFEAVSMSALPFYCPYCRLQNQTREIVSLRDLVVSLSSEVKSLKSQLHQLNTSNGQGPPLAAATQKSTSYGLE